MRSLIKSWLMIAVAFKSFTPPTFIINALPICCSIVKRTQSNSDHFHCYENKPLIRNGAKKAFSVQRSCVYYSAVFYGLHLWFSTVWFSVCVQFKRKIHIPVKITRQRDGFSAVPFSMLLQYSVFYNFFLLFLIFNSSYTFINILF